MMVSANFYSPIETINKSQFTTSVVCNQILYSLLKTTGQWISSRKFPRIRSICFATAATSHSKRTHTPAARNAKGRTRQRNEQSPLRASIGVAFEDRINIKGNRTVVTF